MEPLWNIPAPLLYWTDSCLPCPLKQYQGGGEQKVEEEGSDSIHLRWANIISGPVADKQIK